MHMIDTQKKITGDRRELQGVVVSDKMAKTIVVRIDRSKFHAKYRKQYLTSKKYKVHDEKGEYKVGDVIRFVETRPMSKDKRWRAVGLVRSPLALIPLELRRDKSTAVTAEAVTPSK